MLQRPSGRVSHDQPKRSTFVPAAKHQATSKEVRMEWEGVHRRLISERDGRFPDSLRHAGLTVRSAELDQSAVLATLRL